VSALADVICAERGVHHGRLNLVSVTEHLSHVHPHHEIDHEGHHESHHQEHRHIHFKPTH
jgi:CopG family nickel-responsive transcriptional regulator